MKNSGSLTADGTVSMKEHGALMYSCHLREVGKWDTIQRLSPLTLPETTSLFVTVITRSADPALSG
jgi:hypothetical protein